MDSLSSHCHCSVFLLNSSQPSSISRAAAPSLPPPSPRRLRKDPVEEPLGSIQIIHKRIHTAHHSQKSSQSNDLAKGRTDSASPAAALSASTAAQGSSSASTAAQASSIASLRSPKDTIKQILRLRLWSIDRNQVFWLRMSLPRSNCAGSILLTFLAWGLPCAFLGMFQGDSDLPKHTQ